MEGKRGAARRGGCSDALLTLLGFAVGAAAGGALLALSAAWLWAVAFWGWS